MLPGWLRERLDLATMLGRVHCQSSRRVAKPGVAIGDQRGFRGRVTLAMQRDGSSRSTGFRLFGLSRAEWVGVAFFVAVGLMALPFVHDAVLIQRIWLTICSAVRISG